MKLKKGSFELKPAGFKKEVGPGDPPAGTFAIARDRHLHVKNKKRLKAGIRKFVRPENCAEITTLLPIENGARIHAVVKGDFVICDLLLSIIKKLGPAELTVATLGLKAANAVALADAKAAGLCKSVVVLVSHYFRGVEKSDQYAGILGVFEQANIPCKVARTHAKVFLLSGEFGKYVIEGSANLRASGNIEQLTIFHCPDLYAFHKDWIDEVMESAQ